MQETRVLVETRGTTGEETISYWFELPIDVAEFEEKLGVGAESGDYRIIEKVLPYADEVHEHTTHVAIYVGNNQIYHAGDPIGYADLSSSYWQQHLIGAGRVKQ